MINKASKKAFTVVEILIASTVLALFMTGLFSLYRGGSNLSNATIWAQHTINQLKIACREINTSIKKSTYPTSIIFPGQIIENTGNDFGLHYFDGTMFATQTTALGAAGAKVLYLSESTPGKTGFAAAENADAEIIYHIYTLNSRGQLTFSRWREQIPGNMVAAVTRAAVPPGGAVRRFQSVVARDVESVTCEPTSPGNPRSPLRVVINCRMPRGNTARSEQAIGTPNVDIILRNAVGGW